MTMTEKDLRSAIEAILFVAGEPVTLEALADAIQGEGEAAISAQLEAIGKHFDENVGGFHLEKAAGAFRFASRAEQDPFLRKFFAKQGEGRLSMAALETLAIVAYRQPVTGPEISELRGVNSSGVLRTLLERNMIRIAGRKNVVGSPFLYRTSREFLVHFGLESIQDLPQLEEFTEILGENMVEELMSSGDLAMPAARESDESEPIDSPPAGSSDPTGESEEDLREGSPRELPAAIEAHDGANGEEPAIEEPKDTVQSPMSTED